MYIKSPYYFSDKNVHFKIDDNTYLYLERYDNNMDIGYNVTIENFENLKLRNKLFARQIIWNKESNSWKFKAWKKRTLKSEIEIIENGLEFDTTLLISPSDFDNKYGLGETMTMGELNDFIKLQKLRGSDEIKFYIIEKYIRYAKPFTVIILLILGVIIGKPSLLILVILEFSLPSSRRASAYLSEVSTENDLFLLNLIPYLNILDVRSYHMRLSPSR